MSRLRWIPVEDGYPEEMKDVQVTYIGHNDGKPYCNEIAYRSGNRWYWSNSEDKVIVKITAWKDIGRPYEGEVL